MITLLLRKVFKLNVEGYCFDYPQWDSTKSPYFKYLSLSDVDSKEPYDIIICSHVLEHVASPVKLVTKCSELLSIDEIFIAEVPYELPSIVSPKSSLMNYHQNLFSASSLAKLLIAGGFSSVNSKYSLSASYRGNKTKTIVGFGFSRGNNRQSTFTLSKVIDLLFLLFSIFKSIPGFILKTFFSHRG